MRPATFLYKVRKLVSKVIYFIISVFDLYRFQQIIYLILAVPFFSCVHKTIFFVLSSQDVCLFVYFLATLNLLLCLSLFCNSESVLDLILFYIKICLSFFCVASIFYYKDNLD